MQPECIAVQRLVIFLTKIIVFWLFSTMAFAHAGPHDNQNCFMSLDENRLRLSGYQFQGKHPEHIYCRIFPELGEIIIKTDAVNTDLTDKKIALQLLKLDSWTQWLFHSGKAVSILKQTPLRNFNNGVNMIQTQIQQPGIYMLQVELQAEHQASRRQTFLFLGGIPVTEILVWFSGGILTLLVFMAGYRLFKNQRKQTLADNNTNQN